MKLITTTLAIGLLACSGQAQQNPPAADNTKVNKSQAAPNADQAKNTPDDRAIMQKIRKAVIADKNLSTYAHNVKIISQDGKVTLRGPVHTEEEKQSIEQKATDVAGAGSVTNEITIKPSAPKKKTN